MRFRVTEYITDYAKVGEDYTRVEVSKRYEVANWDDLQNLLMTLIDFSYKDLKFEVKKIEEEPNE